MVMKGGRTVFNHLRTVTAAILALSVLSCGGERTVGTQNTGDSGQPTNKISEHVYVLGYGETAVISPDNVSVTFSDVNHDSRCASDVVCVWEGQVIIHLSLTDAVTGTHVVPLALPGGCDSDCIPVSQAKDTLGYRFQLLRVDPYPLSTVQTPINDYVATVAIFPGEPMATVDGEVVISDQDPSAIADARFVLDNVAIDGDVLTMTFEYGGGCLDHTFELHMSPASFMESLPVQANVYLRHSDFDDPCDAWFKHSATFDLRPIAQLYEISYGSVDCVALNVHGYTDGSNPADVMTVIYHPDGAPPTTWCSESSQ